MPDDALAHTERAGEAGVAARVVDAAATAIVDSKDYRRIGVREHDVQREARAAAVAVLRAVDDTGKYSHRDGMHDPSLSDVADQIERNE